MAMAYNDKFATSGRAVWWPDSGIEVLQGSPPYWHASSYGASNAGEVVVGWGQIGDGSDGIPVQRGFRASASQVTYLNGLNPDDWTYAHAVTPDGATIVGGSAFRACVWTGAAAPTPLASPDGAAAARALSVSADGSRIVGTFRRGQDIGAALWVNGAVTEIPLQADNLLSNLQTQISLDGGAVVGTIIERGGIPRGFTWTESAGFMNIPNAQSALAVSADGSVIGGKAVVGQFTQAALWIDGEMVIVRDLLASRGIDLNGWSLGEVTAISADGLTIAGTGSYRYNASQIRDEGWIAVIPGPSGTVALLGGVLVAARRRR
jgi:uncharacterized membrane protein